MSNHLSPAEFAEHPFASMYQQLATTADEQRFDGIITSEECRTAAASLIISVEESEVLARAAEQAQRQGEVGHE